MSDFMQPIGGIKPWSPPTQPKRSPSDSEGRPERSAVQTLSSETVVERQSSSKSSPVEESISKENVQKAAELLHEGAKHLNRSIQFNVDPQSDRIVVTVVDKETSEIIRQIPSEEALTLARRLHDEGQSSGLWLDEQA